LNADIKEFPDKDFTEIGERGINISGGYKSILLKNKNFYFLWLIKRQKARISLARSLY